MGPCPRCGAAPSTGDAFCGSCGAPVLGGVAPSGPHPLLVGALLAIGGVVVVLGLLAGAGVGRSGGGDDADDDDDRPDAIGALTTPPLSDEEYVIDMLAVAEIVLANATSAEQECDFRSLVAAMGGADALRAAAISPELLAAGFGLRGEEIPEGAVDRYLATAATCGLDLTEVLLVRPMAQDRGADVGQCIDGAIDRAYFDRAIAQWLLDPNRSTNTLFFPTDVDAAYQAVVLACV